MKPRGISLFDEIPERNCEQADIPSAFCACKIVEKVQNSSLPELAPFVNSMLKFLNNEFEKNENLRQKCERLEISRIEHAEMLESLRGEGS